MSKRILVVGGGVSGISAAYRLKQAGMDVTVLEKSDYFGGKVKSMEKAGYMIDQGASIMSSKYTNIIGILKDLGLERELIPGGTVVGFAKGDKVHELDSSRLVIDSLFTPLLSMKSKLAMVKLGIDSLKTKPKLSFEDATAMAEFDTETAAEYCQRRLNPELQEYMVDCTLRGLLGTSAADQSIVDFYFSFNNIIGSSLYAAKNGMGALPRVIVETAGIDVQLGCAVTEVREGESGITVSWTSPDGPKSETVAGVVTALPAIQTSDILPGLSAKQREFLDTVPYTTNVNVNLGLSRPPEGHKSFVIQIPESVQPDLFAIVLDHNKAPGRTPPGKGMASLYAMSKWSEQLIEMDDESLLREMIKAGERIIPGLGSLVEISNINRWYPVVVYSYPGFYKKLAEFRASLDPASNIRLAGDYFSCSNVNTASAAGERAARELIANLR